MLPIGVLAMQGDFASHCRVLKENLSMECKEIHNRQDLVSSDGTFLISALIIPGGESTSMRLIAERLGLWQGLQRFVGEVRPVFGTCAGLILLAKEHLNVLPVELERNAYGSQSNSFLGPIENVAKEIAELQQPDQALQGAFIRAPRILKVAQGVKVLGWNQGNPVAVWDPQRHILATTFHAEILPNQLAWYHLLTV